MGKIRVFKKAVRFSVRSRRRFIVFTLIFAIVSTFVAFYIDSLDDLQTDEFLEQKGVVMRQSGEETVSYGQGQAVIADILALELSAGVEIEDYAAYYYADLDSLLRIYAIHIDKPWFSDFAKPSLVEKGSYPDSKNQILVPDGTFQVRTSDSNTTVIKSEVAIGQQFNFERPNFDTIKLSVSGTIDTGQLQLRADPDRLWIFVDISKFEELVTMFGKTMEDDVFTYGISWVVPGSAIFSSETHKKVSALNDEIIGLVDPIDGPNTDVLYGEWEAQNTIQPSSKAVDDAVNTLTYLGFVIFGGIVLSTMFAYLISRFRRREIAILKAMGYSHGNVRTSLIAEILTISFVGFIVGLTTVQGLLYYFSEFNRNTLLRWEAGLVAFLVSVIISLPGMLLVSRRVLGISPSEAFRDR